MGNPYLLNPEWSTLRKLLVLHGGAGSKLTETEITGNPVAFNTNVAKVLTGFTIPFLPIQSGTGDPSPENIRPISGWTGVTVYRTGKNLINPAEFTDGKAWYNGNMASGYANFSASTKIPVVPGVTYFLSRESLNQNQVCFFDHAGDYLSQASWAINTAKTMGDGVYFVGFSLLKTDKETAQLEVGTSATTFEEYTGQAYPVTFPALGKNLFDKNAATNGKIWWKGKKQDSSNISASDKIPVIPGQAYTLVRNGGNQSQVEYFDSEGTYIDQDVQHWAGATSTYTIPSGVYFVAFNVVTADIDTAMFEKGSTASPYEPYTNTVYGGTLDAVTDVLTVTHKGVSLNDPDKWTKPSGNIVYDVYFNDRKQNYRWNDPCSCFPTTNGKPSGTPYLGWAGQTLNRYAVFTNSSGITLEEVQALATAGKIFCVYELATPLEIPLSNVPVPVTLIGDNTIWTDTNGENTIKYLKKG